MQSLSGVWASMVPWSGGVTAPQSAPSSQPMEWKPQPASHGAMRKARQRLHSEQIKQRLQFVLQFQRPERKADGKKYRLSKTIAVDELTAAAIVRVKEVLSSKGKAGGGGAAQHGVGRVLSLRDAMLSSQTMGTMLVRKQDMLVVESSIAMDCFCPWEKTRGYKQQGLDAMVHTSDVDALIGFIKAARPEAAGSRLSVRLLRLCLDEGSQCLLGQYVPKVVTLSHASPDGSVLLLTVDVSAADSAPLAVQPGFMQRFNREAHALGTGPFRIVNDGQGIVEFMNWAAERGVPALGKEYRQAQGAVQSMFKDSFAHLQGMGDMLLETFPQYGFICPDPRGRPRFQLACKLSHGNYSTKWNPYISWSPSGQPDSMGVLGGIGSLEHVGVLLLQEGGTGGLEDEELEPILMDLFMSVQDNGDKKMEGAWAWYFRASEVHLLGHLRTIPGAVMKRNSYGIKIPEAKDPALERVMMQQASGPGFFVLPFSLDNLSLASPFGSPTVSPGFE